MMKRQNWILGGLLAFTMVIGPTLGPALEAASEAREPEQRIANQQKRIDQALHAKEITPDEAKMLQGNLDKAKEELTRMKADGKFTKEEKDKLNGMLDQNGQLITKTREASKAASAAPAKAAETAAGKVVKSAPEVPAAKPPVPAPPKVAAPPAPAPPKAVSPAPEDPAVQKAMADQQRRIHQGVQSKQLTLEESKTLEQNLSAIREQDEARRAHGRYTQADRDQVLRMLDQNSKMIQDKKNNPVMNMRDTLALEDRTHSVPERIAHQQERIENGIRSRELTREEAKILYDNLNYIKAEEARLRTGGRLTDREREHLHAMLDQNGEMIYNKKHNPVKRLR
jgi:hypothetical protein